MSYQAMKTHEERLNAYYLMKKSIWTACMLYDSTIWPFSVSHSVVSLFATPWTVACQGPSSMEFPRQEFWSGFPFPSPGYLPDPGIEPGCPTLQADALSSEPPGKPPWRIRVPIPPSRDSLKGKCSRNQAQSLTGLWPSTPAWFLGHSYPQPRWRVPHSGLGLWDGLAKLITLTLGSCPRKGTCQEL